MRGAGIRQGARKAIGLGTLGFGKSLFLNGRCWRLIANSSAFRLWGRRWPAQHGQRTGKQFRRPTKQRTWRLRPGNLSDLVPGTGDDHPSQRRPVPRRGMPKRSIAMHDYRLSAASKGMAQIGPDRPRLDSHAADSGTAAARPMHVENRSVLAHQQGERQRCLSQPSSTWTRWNGADFDLSLTYCADLTLR